MNSEDEHIIDILGPNVTVTLTLPMEDAKRIMDIYGLLRIADHKDGWPDYNHLGNLSETIGYLSSIVSDYLLTDDFLHNFDDWGGALQTFAKLMPGNKGNIPKE